MTNNSTPPGSQGPIPIGVGFLATMGVVQGAFTVLVGLFVLLDRNAETLQAHTALSSTQLASIGAGAIVGGIIHTMLSLALRNGSQPVRLWFGLVALVNVAVAFWGVVGTHAEQRFAAAGSMVVGIFVLWLLFGSNRAIEFFDDGGQ